MSKNVSMLRFSYSALDASGAQVSGVEAATSSGAAHLALVQRGFQPLEVMREKEHS